jgi:MoxR-like ATPase
MRSAQALAVMQGYDFATPYHVQKLAEGVLSHRLILSGEAKRKNITKEEVVSSIIEKVKVPLW